MRSSRRRHGVHWSASTGSRARGCLLGGAAATPRIGARIPPAGRRRAGRRIQRECDRDGRLRGDHEQPAVGRRSGKRPPSRRELGTGSRLGRQRFADRDRGSHRTHPPSWPPLAPPAVSRPIRDRHRPGALTFVRASCPPRRNHRSTQRCMGQLGEDHVRHSQTRAHQSGESDDLILEVTLAPLPLEP